MKKCGNVALLVIAYICMWGCYDDPCDDMGYVWTGQTEKKIVGFVNDSFALVAHANRWSYEADCMCSGERFGLGRWTLGVYNYREQLDGPVFEDSVDDGYGQYMYVLGQLSDSVIWGGDTDPNLLVWENGTSFSFWRIGENPVVKKISIKMDGCGQKFSIEGMRTWFDGLILAFGKIFYAQSANDLLNAGGDTCQYAVLDTMTRTLTYKRLDEDLKWIQKCDDVRVWGKDVYCVMPSAYNFKAFLLRNDRDTIDIPIKFTTGAFWGDMLKLNGHLCNFVEGEVDCSGIVWRGGLSFYENNEIVVDLERMCENTYFCF